MPSREDAEIQSIEQINNNPQALLETSAPFNVY
jgi:hypothetical protein